MKSKFLALSVACLLGNSAFTCHAATLPMIATEGVKIEKLSPVLAAPRFLTFTKEGDMIVGSGAEKVYRVKAPYTTSEVLVEFSGYPHSVAMRNTANGQELWVGATDGLYKVAYSSGKTYTRADFTKVVALPAGGGHSSRTVKISPDNEVYVSLGISSNCSVQYVDESYPENNRRGGINRLDESGPVPKLVPFGKGLRNPIGFNWHPVTKVMYSNNNGPDHWGFDEPREVFVEVNEGDFFGMPWYQFVKDKVTVDSCAPADKAPQVLAAVEKPVATFLARSAPMETLFVEKGLLNPAWEHSALVAIHGSWAIPTGGDEKDRRRPMIDLVEFVDGKATGKVTELVTNFQDDAGERFARPVGLAFGPDKALYFTSDQGNEGVYRLTYTPKAATK